ARFDVLPDNVNRRQPRDEGQGVYPHPVRDHERVADHIECIRTILERLEGGCNVLGASDFESRRIDTKRACGDLNLAHFRRGVGYSPLAMIASGRRPGTTSRNSASRLPAASGHCIDRPVMLPPGCARLATRPAPTGSPDNARTIGMTDVAFFAW